MAANQIYNKTLQDEQLRQQVRDSSIARTLQQMEMQRDYDIKQAQMALEREKMSRDEVFRQKQFDFQAQQAQQPEFNLSRELFNAYQGGKRQPEVLKGLDMYVEPEQTPDNAVSASLAQQYGLRPIGIENGRVKWGLAQDSATMTPYQQERINIEKQKIGSGGELSPLQRVQQATTLRKELNTSQIKKDYDEISSAKMKMDLAMKQAQSGNRIAADQALGVVFQKMLDPGSVVRESEFARTEQGQSFLNRISGIWEKMARGGLSLKDDDRMALVRMASEIYNGSEQMITDQLGYYSSLAERSGLNPEDVVGGIKTQTARFSPNAASSNQDDIRQQYNALRSQGVSVQEAKKRLGL